jgi:drug/metabolite transporter (DMT)-like permease
MSGPALGMALAFTALLLFSSNIILTKLAMARLALDVGFLIVVVVNVLFAAIVFGLQLAWRRAPLAVEAYAFGMFLLSGAFTTWLGRWFFFEAVARLGSARASVFQISSPLFTALVAWAFLGERIPATVAVAMVVVIAGMYLVAVPARGSRRTDRDGSGGALRRPGGRTAAFARGFATVLRSGLVLGAGSSLAYAVGNVLRGAAVHRWPEPVLGALLGATTGIVLVLAFGRRTHDVRAAIRAADANGVLLYAACGALSIAAQMLAIASMTYIPVSIAALITLCSPIFVIPMSLLVFGKEERINPRMLVGSALALAGIAVIVLR